VARRLFQGAAQSLFLLRPAQPELFKPERFPTFGADISTTGITGSAARERVVKISNHGPGRDLDPTGRARCRRPTKRSCERSFAGVSKAGGCSAREQPGLHLLRHQGRAFLDRPRPEHEGLTVATGGSGHAFKFAPLLGQWIADATLGVPNEELRKFRWRPELKQTHGKKQPRPVIGSL